MWFGTETGLHLFHEEDSTFSVYRSENGLPSNIINAILEDKEGNIWLSTNNGISKFIQGSSIPQKPVFENYNLWDGLQGNKFNQRSAIQDADGYLYFGVKTDLTGSIL
jgi:ligand-binding sensor domain-containing protein